ncbi:hypothetical protein D3C72_1230500 [compost metagenome]
MVQIVVHGERRGGKYPASRFLRHHLFEFIGHGQRRERQGELTCGAFIPVAKAGLVDLFKTFQARAVQRGALKSGVEQGAAPEGQLSHVITQLQRIIEQQQRALDITVG